MFYAIGDYNQLILKNISQSVSILATALFFSIAQVNPKQFLQTNVTIP